MPRVLKPALGMDKGGTVQQWQGDLATSKYENEYKFGHEYRYGHET